LDVTAGRFAVLIVIVTAVDASTNATVVASIHSAPMSIIRFLNLDVFRVFFGSDRGFCR